MPINYNAYHQNTFGSINTHDLIQNQTQNNDMCNMNNKTKSFNIQRSHLKKNKMNMNLNLNKADKEFTQQTNNTSSASTGSAKSDSSDNRSNLVHHDNSSSNSTHFNFNQK